MSGRDKVTAWLKSAAYLPPILRDFHDQKDVFKAIDEVKERSVASNGGSYMRNLSWIDAQVYTIDIFLWMMARHGYTLQRSRKRMAYDDLDAFVGDAKRRNDEQAARALGLTPIRQQEGGDHG